MWIIGQYDAGWVVCVICRVKQPPEALTPEGQCKNREQCIKWCREPGREWVDDVRGRR